MLKWPNKDPDEVLDYKIDWTPRLDGDTIVTSIFIVTPSDIVVDSSFNTTTESTIWLSGGILNKEYSITNRIVTTDGRTMDQTVKLSIRQK